MTEQRDDDALSWAGDDDPTLAPSGGSAADASDDERGETADLATEADTATSARLDEPEARSRPSVHDEPIERSESTEAGVPATAPPETTVDAAVPVREQMSSPMLVTLGIFGGVFLLYSVGWLISAFRPDAAVPSDAVGEFMFNLGQGLAVAAGPVWMATTLWLTRDSKPFVRIAMLVLGVVLVLPWPFLRGV